MKKMYAIILYFVTILFFSAIAITCSIRFLNPKLTETELFLNYWYMIPINIVLGVLVIRLFDKID